MDSSKVKEVVIDVDNVRHGSLNIEEGSSNLKKVCRICKQTSDITQLADLGCDCEGVVFFHLDCALTGIESKGNKICKVCKDVRYKYKSTNNNNNKNNTMDKAGMSSTAASWKTEARERAAGLRLLFVTLVFIATLIRYCFR